MDKKALASLIVRLIQFLAAVIVLGLSVSLYKILRGIYANCDDSGRNSISCPGYFQPWISFSAYGACVGVWGLLDAAVGGAATCVHLIPWVAVIALDVLTAIFYVAGALTLAIKWARANDFHRPCGNSGVKKDWKLEGFPPCSRFPAEATFMFIGLLVTLLALALVLISRRAGRRSVSAPAGHAL